MIFDRLRKRVLAISSREPDLYIGGKEDPYLIRWYVIPRNKWFNIYLHNFRRSDDDRALHDHPWLFNISWLLDGGYKEVTQLTEYSQMITARKKGDWKFRWGKAPHRVMLHHLFKILGGGPEAPCWTLFITGPVVREWGFYCPQGWRHWKDFLNVADGQSTMSKGCE